MRAAPAGRLAAAIERLWLTLLRERGLVDQAGATPLTSTQRLALTVVVDEGPVRLGGLAAAMGTTEATATRTVDSLVAEALVERAPHPTDRRGVLVRATPRGRRVLAARREHLTGVVERGLAGMAPDDRERLVDLLDRLNELLAPESGEPAEGDRRY